MSLPTVIGELDELLSELIASNRALFDGHSTHLDAGKEMACLHGEWRRVRPRFLALHHRRDWPKSFPADGDVPSLIDESAEWRSLPTGEEWPLTVEDSQAKLDEYREANAIRQPTESPLTLEVLHQHLSDQHDWLKRGTADSRRRVFENWCRKVQSVRDELSQWADMIAATTDSDEPAKAPPAALSSEGKPVEPQGETLARGEGANGRQPRPKGTGHRRTNEELFKSAMRAHHKYETGGSVLNVEPVSTRRIEELTERGISDSTAGRLLTKHFGSVDKYRDACFSGAIGPKLVVLLGDGLHAFGSFDATERDPEDQDDNDSDE